MEGDALQYDQGQPAHFVEERGGQRVSNLGFQR